MKMNKKDVLHSVVSELRQAAQRAECRKCGCMKETLLLRELLRGDSVLSDARYLRRQLPAADVER